jgi:hypothetical protein
MATVKKPNKGKKQPRKKNRFSNIELPDRSGDTERKGKLNIPWHEDPEILARLAEVAGMMNKNRPSYVIAEETGTSIATAKRDMKRVREFWKMDAKERLGYTTEEAIAQYEAIASDARDDLDKAPISLKASYYMVILRALERRDKAAGIADPVSVQGVPGKPVEVSVADMDKIRLQRWAAIADKLPKVSNGEQ